jgi:hypothetical protein
MKSTRIAKEKYSSSAQPCNLLIDNKKKAHQHQSNFTVSPSANDNHVHMQHNTNATTQYHSATILKGFILFSLALMISLTILYIVRHCIVDMVVRYGFSSKHEMLMYLLTLLVLLGVFGLYYHE